MNLSELTAISPIDGRYRNKVTDFANYFSEFALIKYRVKVEVEYVIALSEVGLEQIPPFTKDQKSFLRDLYNGFSQEDAMAIKKIESVTNHDVKAVEYFIKEKLPAAKLDGIKEFIHFGLTSQDINNTAVPLSLHDAFDHVYYPALAELMAKLNDLATEWANVPMLARTHGQPASPTRLGKEIQVFIERIEQQVKLLRQVPYAAKFGGATGNFNAHLIAFPKTDWKAFGTNFIEKVLGLRHSFPTTQIEHYDHLAAQMDAVKRINTILVDLDRDIWTYISMGYFGQKIKKGEIGSSAMPHKVNPIDFENSEGNLGIANAVLEHLSAKLPISRLQRDLTDSTVLRNLGVPFAHTVIAFKATLKGLNKLLLNQGKIEKDLQDNWAVVAEAVQTVLRREAYPNPYEALKELTRKNEGITEKSMLAFIETLDVNETIKAELRAITPYNYTGI